MWANDHQRPVGGLGQRRRHERARRPPHSAQRRPVAAPQTGHHVGKTGERLQSPGQLRQPAGRAEDRRCHGHSEEGIVGRGAKKGKERLALGTTVAGRAILAVLTDSEKPTGPEWPCHDTAQTRTLLLRGTARRSPENLRLACNQRDLALKSCGIHASIKSALIVQRDYNCI